MLSSINRLLAAAKLLTASMWPSGYGVRLVSPRALDHSRIKYPRNRRLRSAGSTLSVCLLSHGSLWLSVAKLRPGDPLILCLLSLLQGLPAQVRG